MMKKNSTRSVSRWSVGLAVAALTFSVAAHAAFTSIGGGSSNFEAKGPGGLKIQGKGPAVTISESGGKIAAKLDLTGFKTGISLRDDHLNKALKTSVNKYAVLTVDRSAVKVPSGGAVEGSAKGDLAFNGVTKPITFKYKAEGKGPYDVQALMTVDIEKWGMEKPCYLGVCVDKDVNLKFDFKVKD